MSVLLACIYVNAHDQERALDLLELSPGSLQEEPALTALSQLCSH